MSKPRFVWRPPSFRLGYRIAAPSASMSMPTALMATREELRRFRARVLEGVEPGTIRFHGRLDAVRSWFLLALWRGEVRAVQRNGRTEVRVTGSVMPFFVGWAAAVMLLRQTTLTTRESMVVAAVALIPPAFLVLAALRRVAAAAVEAPSLRRQPLPITLDPAEEPTPSP